jgi:hypothetical protein
MYGPGIDKSFSRTMLNVGFEDRPRKTLEVRIDIAEETLMTAIAELYGVGGELQLHIEGIAAGGWYDVSSSAKYTLYRVDAILRIWPQYLLKPRFINPQGGAPVPITMRYGMREARVAVRQDTMRSALIAQLVEQFRACRGEWAVVVEKGARVRQADFRIEPEWRYTLEPARRPTVRVVMKFGKHERVVEVPEGTSEAGMKQLLVSGFGVDIRKRWEVITRTQLNREDPYELKRNRTYELKEYTPAEAKESLRVMANTRLNGLQDDIEIETCWGEGQVHQACLEAWRNELHPAQDGCIPSTKLFTLDERLQRVQFEAREGMTYELRLRPQTPQWVLNEKMAKGPAPTHPNELVMVGLQLGDGPRVERKVKRSVGEHGLKLLAWELFDCPQGPLYLHIVSARGETEFALRVEPQWTYILRTQPMKVIRAEPSGGGADDGGRAAKPKKGAQRERNQDVLQLGARRQITGWCGTKTATLTVSDTTTKSDLIDRIAEKLKEPKGSYSMEIRDRGNQVRNEYAVAEGWSYKIYRMSPPGTQEAADQRLRHQGNETRALLNRRSLP